jgi:hypothetical protein
MGRHQQNQGLSSLWAEVRIRRLQRAPDRAADVNVGNSHVEKFVVGAALMLPALVGVLVRAAMSDRCVVGIAHKGGGAPFL